MARLEMEGPFCFTREEIDEVISLTGPGNYALGYVDKDNVFIVRYVGRADGDVNDRIKDHIGEDYSAFKFSYAISSKAAFEKECHNYHDFGGPEGKLENKIHPDIPDNSKNLKCPVCGYG